MTVGGGCRGGGITVGDSCRGAGMAVGELGQL